MLLTLFMLYNILTLLTLHAVHANMKSHAGSMSTLGLGAIDAGSSALDKEDCDSVFEPRIIIFVARTFT